jgi:hypothetical protein
MFPPIRPTRSFRLWLPVLLCAALPIGCALTDLVETGKPQQVTWKEVFGNEGPEFVSASQPELETIILEVAHLEQPLGDLSMIDLLWKEVDQIGALDFDVRRELESNGIRIGITGPNPPRILQSLMDVDVQWRSQRNDGQPVSQNIEQVPLFPNRPGTVLSSDRYTTCRIEVPRGSKREEVVYENAQCLFRIEAEKLQEGWVKLEFVPEIHHGQDALRRVASEDGWQLSNSQKVDTLYSQRFSLTLNRGEIAVLTAVPTPPGQLGHAFFVGNGENDEKQRVLVVRLVDIVPARQKHSRER